MTRPRILHYAVECDGILGSVETRACCGNDFRRAKKLTDDWREVTCQTCRQLCGFDEALTVCEGEPLLRRHAA